MFPVLKKQKHQTVDASLMEQCKNPLNPECNNKDIAVYLQINQEKVPICQHCWNQLAETTIEWNQEI